MRSSVIRPMLFAGALLAGALAAPMAHADDWRGRGYGSGWGGPGRYYAPAARYYGPRPGR